MGLLINDSITLNNGMTIQGAYLTLNAQHLGLIPGNSATLSAKEVKAKAYTACAGFKLYVNKNAMLAGNTPVQEGRVDVQVDSSGLSTPLHQIVYDYIKQKVYPNSTDC